MIDEEVVLGGAGAAVEVLAAGDGMTGPKSTPEVATLLYSRSFDRAGVLLCFWPSSWSGVGLGGSVATVSIGATSAVYSISGGDRHSAPTMVVGSTTRSNSAALMSPLARAASRRLMPLSLAAWAMALALS
jgi:hypothetical protein